MSDRYDLSAIAGDRRDISRRELLRRAGIGAGAVSMSAFLAACGVGGSNETGDQNQDDGLTTTKENGELNFANWPLYIDRAKGRRPTLDDFTKASGIQVNYKENIQDNETFFGTIQEPLANDQAIEWDIVVLTDWMIARMIRLGYLEELDHSLLPNFEAHAGQIYKDPVYDPSNAHSVPWQSGITGIGYDPKLTGGEITSFNQLFDPSLEGKVGMFKEMRDTFTLTLLSLDIDPQEASIADIEAATEKLIEQREQGIVRQYYGNEYADALLRGDLAATMAWSGDVFQLQFDNPDLRFVVPDEGGVLWVDNMAIPQNAANPIDAHTFMDFVYDPEIAAQITGWVNYICPVPEAQDLLLKQGEKDSYYKTVAESPLVFPTPEMEANLHGYKDLTADEEEQWQDLFQSVIQG
nr:spermidine/putrescine ABC transporter substrate-binding protein [Actinomycetota bacterium]